jgi:hypothetical protein
LRNVKEGDKFRSRSVHIEVIPTHIHCLYRVRHHLAHVLFSRRLAAFLLKANIAAQQSELFLQQKRNLESLGDGNCRNRYIFALRSISGATSYDRTENTAIGEATGLDLANLKQLDEIIA